MRRSASCAEARLRCVRPGRHEGEEVRVKGFLERLQWKLSGMMQGRRGADTFSNFLVVAGIVLLFASLIPGLDLLSWVALIVLAYSLFRSYSKNIAARDRDIGCDKRDARLIDRLRLGHGCV